MQQSLAEYKFSQNTDFIYRRVPGIAWNVLKNISLQFTGIFYLHLHSYSSLAKMWLSIRNRISPGLKVFHITLYLTVFWVTFCFLSESIDCERKSLDCECHNWNRGICGDIHRLHTYLHPKISNEAGFRHRQLTLVMYMTWISLLQSLVALQQQ